jgi:hypothetical protein
VLAALTGQPQPHAEMRHVPLTPALAGHPPAQRTFGVGLRASDGDGVPLPAADAGHQHEQLADGALAGLRWGTAG